MIYRSSSRRRRQVDRQLADLEKVRSRAGALLTLCLAELAALSAGASRVFTHSWLILPWALSAACVLLSVGGAIALLTAQAQFRRVDTAGIALVPPSRARRVAAQSYAEVVGMGEETIATRITVLRDGVLLAVVAALLYASVWPAVTLGASGGNTPDPVTSTFPGQPTMNVLVPSPASSGGASCLTCTPSSVPSSSTSLTTPRTNAPGPLPTSPTP